MPCSWRHFRHPALGALLLAAGALPVAAVEPNAAGASAEVLARALSIVVENYRRPVSAQALLESALDGMLEDLDPYSVYLDPVEWRSLHEGLRGEFAGIGAVLDLDPAGRPRVARLLPQSPSLGTGLAEGDAIVAIDGRPTVGLALEDVIPLLRGEAGTRVRLTVIHPGTSEPDEIEIERRPIKVSSVRGAAQARDGRQIYLLAGSPRIAYLRIEAMASDTAAAVAAALEELADDDLRGLVIDLRQTPGGFLRAAVETADLFLDAGRLVTVTSRGDVEKAVEARPGRTDVPLAVLINGETASAAEVLAAALQDHRRAALVGQGTWGKGYVGNLFSLGEGKGGLRLTVSSFQRPSGQTLDRHEAPPGSAQVGVAPDPGLEVVLEGAEAEAWIAAYYSPQPIAEAGAVAPAPMPDDRALEKALAALGVRDAAPNR